MKKVFSLIALVVLIPLFSGCATYERPAPPPLQAEVAGPAPYPGAVWVGGYWTWMQSGYVWVPGHWAPAPPPAQVEVVGVAPFYGAVWVGGRWAWRHGNYVWIHGHWRRGY